MGNTTSESVDHSFKRFRLSKTEQLSLVSPTCTSPKRKISSVIRTGSINTSDNKTENNIMDQLPTLLCNDNVTSVSATPTLESSKTVMGKPPDTYFLSDDDLMDLLKSFPTSVSLDSKHIRTNGTPSDAGNTTQLMNTNVLSELSDTDFMECLQQSYINKSQ